MNTSFSSLLTDTALRGALWLAIAWLGFFILRALRASAATRHLVCVAAFAALALLPLVIVALPAWRLLPASAPKAAVSVASTPAVVTPLVVPTAFSPPTEAPYHFDALPVSSAPTQVPSSSSIPAVHPWTWPKLFWPQIFAMFWIPGCVLFLVRLVAEILRLRLIANHASCRVDEKWTRLAHRIAADARLSRSPRLAISTEITGPLVWSNGVFLPLSSKNWPQERWDTVLRHEFTHVARRDGAVQIFAFLVCALHWFNPLAWLLLRRLRLESEHACDDAVLTQQGQPADYAEHLLAVAAGGSTASFAAPTMARASTLRRRVEQILRANVNRRRPGRRMALALVVLSALVAIPLAIAQQKTPAELKPAPVEAKAKTENVDTVQVSVTTTDTSGKPLAGVSLRGMAIVTRDHNHPFQPDFEGTTDDQGHWSAKIPFGEYAVLATRDNLVASEADHQKTNWSLFSNKEHPDFHLRLIEGGDVLVRVVDAATRAPVPQVQLVMDDGQVGITDEHGNAKLRAVALKEHQLQGFKPPYGDKIVSFNNIDQPSTEVEIPLSPGFEVRGRITDSSGKPIANAGVRDYYSGSWLHIDRHRSITDADGRYQLGWYPVTRPLSGVEAGHNDYASQVKRDIQPPASGNTVTWDFVMDQGYAITGSVIDEQGHPVKSAVIRYGGPTLLADGREVKSDDGGLFHIRRIATDRRELVIVQADGYAPAFQMASASKDKVPHLDFTLGKGFAVEGQIVDRSGHPVPNANIFPQWVMNGDAENVGHGVSAEKDGHFKLKNLPATGNALTVFGKGISPVQSFAFDLTKPLVVTVDRPGFIIGRVLDKETQQSITRFNVRLSTPHEPPAPDEPRGGFSLQLFLRGQDCVAKDGAFVIEDLLTRGGHAVRIAADGYANGYVDKVIAAPKDDKNWPVTIALERGHSVRGVITDATTGKPLLGASLLVLPDASKINGMAMSSFADWQMFEATEDGFIRSVDPEGQFEFRVLDARQPFCVLVQAPGYAPVKLEEQASHVPASWNISLSRGATLRGTIGYKPAGKDRLIYVRAGNLNFDSIHVHADGTFEAGGLPEGTAVVTLLSSNRETEKSSVATVELVAGHTTVVDFATQSKAGTSSSEAKVKTDHGAQATGASIPLPGVSPSSMVMETHDPSQILGIWYFGGRSEDLCSIASGPRGLTARNQGGSTSQIAFHDVHDFTATSWENGVKGSLVDGRILWDNGTWWQKAEPH